jgi:hypothetical protein
MYRLRQTPEHREITTMPRKRTWRQFYFSDGRYERFCSAYYNSAKGVAPGTRWGFEGYPIYCVTTNATLEDLRRICRLDALRLPSDWVTLPDDDDAVLEILNGN